ncbi:MAG: aminotransferase class V-fold PLP-dependent enzyme [Planctomycetota bacterium]|nr:aminotransferase class V-fold PLP-dependent enzyme [Planctomycetota bacterium]
MAVRPRFYLDHAATSWPKPPGSLEACISYQTSNGAAAGRGVYQSAEAASELVRTTRQAIAKLIGAPNANDVALCCNGTQALNAAILGLLQSRSMRDCHVVTTATEHNSVLRPLQLATHSSGITWTAVPCDATGWVDPNQLRGAMTANTRLVVVNHVSNVTGTVQDIEAIAAIAKERQALFLVDAAQSLGYLPIDVVKNGIDMLAAPGHKGAGGMLGTGILYVRSDLQKQMETIWIGGTGTQSDSIDGPFDWLAAIESGNSNLPAIASLKAGLEWLRDHKPTDSVRIWSERILKAIQQSPNLKLVGLGFDHPTRSRLPVFSLICQTLSCHEAAMLLDSACGVETRSGFHCAGLVHSYLGTKDSGGTLRLSLGHTSTLADVEAAIAGIQLLRSM